MLGIRLGLGVTVGANKDRVVGRIRVAITAQCRMVRNREPSVVESRARPSRRGVASLASGGESRRLVIWIGGSRVIFGVAGIAIGGRACKLAADVATGARNADVSTGKREWSLRVVEDRARPRCRGMADRTVGGISRLHMIRVRRPGVILGMAGIAIRGRSGKFIIDVALAAGDVDVKSGQGKWSFRVIKNRASPRSRGVTDGAVGGKSGRGVIRVGGPCVVLGMAAITIGWSSGKLAVDMAERAGNIYMCAC